MGDDVALPVEVGNMFTFPPYRGEGLARQVIDAATRTLMESDVDMGALLCEEHLVPMYRASGWSAADAPTFHGTPEHATAVEAVRMMVFVSPKARQARRSLLATPLYVAEPC